MEALLLTCRLEVDNSELVSEDEEEPILVGADQGTATRGSAPCSGPVSTRRTSVSYGAASRTGRIDHLRVDVLSISGR